MKGSGGATGIGSTGHWRESRNSGQHGKSEPVDALVDEWSLAACMILRLSTLCEMRTKRESPHWQLESPRSAPRASLPSQQQGVVLPR